MKKNNFVFLNKFFLKRNKAKIGIDDESFYSGFGVYEIIGVKDGSFFLFNEHLKDLKDGLKVLGIKLGISGKRIRIICKKLLEINNLEFGLARLRLTVTPSNLLIESTRSLQPAKQATAVTMEIERSVPKIKSTSCLSYYLAKNYAKRKKVDDVLFVNNGYLTEGYKSNIFLVKNNKLFTPLEKNIHAGVTRNKIIEIAKKYKIVVVEKNIKPNELFKSDELFLTASLTGVMPIIEVNNIKINKGKVGLISNFFREEYGFN